MKCSDQGDQMGTNMNVYMTNVSINHQIKPRKVRITISMNVSSTYTVPLRVINISTKDIIMVCVNQNCKIDS